jgi:hypothetical protein
MFQRLYELSKCLPPRESWERLNEGMPENYDRGLAICFDDQGRWTGIESYQDNDHVVYRSGPPNGTDLTPCCKQAGNTNNRLGDAVRKLVTHSDLTADKNAWLTASLAAFEANRDTIWEAVEGKFRGAGVDGKTHRGYVYWARTVAEPVHAWPEAKVFLTRQFLQPLLTPHIFTTAEETTADRNLCNVKI